MTIKEALKKLFKSRGGDPASIKGQGIADIINAMVENGNSNPGYAYEYIYFAGPQTLNENEQTIVLTDGVTLLDVKDVVESGIDVFMFLPNGHTIKFANKTAGRDYKWENELYGISIRVVIDMESGNPEDLTIEFSDPVTPPTTINGIAIRNMRLTPDFVKAVEMVVDGTY